MKRISILAITLSIFASIFAQEASWCGTEISQEWMDAFYTRDRSHLQHKSGNLEEVIIPIKYSIVGDNNGNGYFSLKDLFRAHCELQDLYDAANIKFYIIEIEYINNTNYYNGTNTDGLFQTYNNRDVCNVYFVSQMSGVCGYSYVPEPWDGFGWSGPNRGGVMLANNCMNAGNTTYRHEMGHYLNLPHTFYGWEGQNAPSSSQNAPNSIAGSPVERADGSNCLNSGDGFCDTPPDYLSDRWTCNFDRTFRDPAGNIFIVDKNNYMSYSNDGCATYLKDDQLAEVNSSPAAYRSYLFNLTPPDISGLGTIVETSPSTITTNLSPTNLTLSWEAIERADYYLVEATVGTFFNPILSEIVTDTFYTFNALSNRTYQWRVRPISLNHVCSDFSAIKTFTTARFSAELSATNVTCLNNIDGAASVLVNSSGTLQYIWTSEDPLINANLQLETGDQVINLPLGSYVLFVVRNVTDTLALPFSIANDGNIEVVLSSNSTSITAQINGGTPPYTILWSNGDNDLIAENPAIGTNVIQVVDQNGCEKTTTFNFTGNVSAIHSSSTQIQISSLFPNPNSGNIINLMANFNNSGFARIQILDISGRVLSNFDREIKSGLNTMSFDVEGLSKGIYFFQLSFDGEKVGQKFVMNH